MLIWTAEGFKSFSPILQQSTPTAPIESKKRMRDWINTRNAWIKDHNALLERARIRFAADPRFVGASDAPFVDFVEMPLWALD